MDAPIQLTDLYRTLGLTPAPRPNLGEFAVLSIAEAHARMGPDHAMPYNRRAYYKISLIEGRNRVEYADRSLEITDRALLFASPRVPYHYAPIEGRQAGTFCVFTDAFLAVDPRGAGVDALPLFRPGGYPVFALTAEQAREVDGIFTKLRREVVGDYTYRQEAIVNYLFELIHYGQKLSPLMDTTGGTPTNGSRLVELFRELLHRQFAGLRPERPLMLRAAGDYAGQLAVHVNHLNTVLKAATGHTTTALIQQRLLQEARVLLLHTDWTIAEVAFALGFRERSHFSAFFRQRGGQSPTDFRQRQR